MRSFDNFVEWSKLHGGAYAARAGCAEMRLVDRNLQRYSAHT